MFGREAGRQLMAIVVTRDETGPESGMHGFLLLMWRWKLDARGLMHGESKTLRIRKNTFYAPFSSRNPAILLQGTRRPQLLTSKLWKDRAHTKESIAMTGAPSAVIVDVIFHVNSYPPMVSQNSLWTSQSNGHLRFRLSVVVVDGGVESNQPKRPWLALIPSSFAPVFLIFVGNGIYFRTYSVKMRRNSRTSALPLVRTTETGQYSC